MSSRTPTLPFTECDALSRSQWISCLVHCSVFIPLRGACEVSHCTSGSKKAAEPCPDTLGQVSLQSTRVKSHPTFNSSGLWWTHDYFSLFQWEWKWNGQKDLFYSHSVDCQTIIWDARSAVGYKGSMLFPCILPYATFPSNYS